MISVETEVDVDEEARLISIDLSWGIHFNLAEVASQVSDEGGSVEHKHMSRRLDRSRSDLNSHRAATFT